MNPKQRQLITERLQHFKNDVDPLDLFPHLHCLTPEDQQEVESVAKGNGSIRAVSILIDRLRRRKNGFEQFVIGLRKESLDHVALLLDPFEEVEEKDAVGNTFDDDSQIQMIGTALDVEVTGRLHDLNLDTRKMELERLVAKEFESPANDNSKKIRKVLKKHMPRGIEFVRTKQMGHALLNMASTQKNKDCVEEQEEEKEKDDTETASNTSSDTDEPSVCDKDSITVIFRLTSADVATQFWEMFNSKELEKKLFEHLVCNTLAEKNEIVESLKLKLMFLEDNYKSIIEYFESNESSQNLERTGNDLLSNGDDEQTSELDDDVVIRIPDVWLETQRNQRNKRNLKLREYQKELADPALQGRNAVICAPTNSGKTFVAMEIAKLHLEAHKKDETLSATNDNINSASPKVIFIVSTQNLVLQQRTRFEDYLTKYSISDISGSNSTEIPLDFLLKTHDVIILTAQILLNALEKNNVEITQISLLIFDECHHTNKDHSYNKIMQKYMAIKYLAQKDAELPQIVGLTASLGVGKSSESDKAKNHILKICANMDASCISTVRANVDELDNNVRGGVPRRKLEKVDQEPNVFEKVVNQIMGKIENAALIHMSNRAPADRVSQQYRQWVEGLHKHAIGKGLRDLVTYAQQLRRYHVALLINDTVRVKDAMKYLDDFFDTLDKSKFQATDQKLTKLFQQAKEGIQTRVNKAEPVNPKLNKLKELIMGFHKEDEAKGRKGETKGILFTRTRDSTVGLQGWIHETNELNETLRPKVLVGAGDGEVGMTQGEQEAIIEEFKKGEVNILIATTVAEEGLDIGDCNFVIRYNMTGNEISSVQSRGRIRADDGNYVYLSDSRSKGVNRELLNQYREILMTTAVLEVQELPEEDYLREIKAIQKKDVQDIGMKNMLSAKKSKSKHLPDDVTFYCRKCNKLACHLSDFRRLKDSFHVIMDKEFKERIKLKPRKKPKKVDDVLMATKVHCAHCDEDWGVTVKIDGFTWPCLKICCFAVQFPAGRRIMFKKWSEFPAVIPEAELSEILEMMDDGLTFDPDDLEFDL